MNHKIFIIIDWLFSCSKQLEIPRLNYKYPPKLVTCFLLCQVWQFQTHVLDAKANIIHDEGTTSGTLDKLDFPKLCVQ